MCMFKRGEKVNKIDLRFKGRQASDWQQENS